MMTQFFATCYGVQYTAEEAAIAAKYDVIAVNQNTSVAAKAWFDSVRGLNPSIKIIAYLIVSQEPGSAPGVGNTILMDANRWSAASQDPWLITPTGDIAAMQLDTWKNRRLFDYRKAVWQTAFKDACRAILNAYPFDGLFFDNCTANWTKMVAYGGTEMATALQNVLLDVRREFPNKLLIGNGVENWMGLNGEMNEGRLADIAELTPYVGQVVPNANTFFMAVQPSTTEQHIQETFLQVKPYGAMFGAYRWDGVLSWPAIFETLKTL